MKFCAIILFFFLANCSFSQVIKFNNNYQDTTPVIRNIVVLDSGYVFVGGGGSPVSILIMGVDTAGDFKWRKKISYSGYKIYHGGSNSLINTHDNGFVIAGGIESSTNYASVVIRLNNTFDTIYVKKYFSGTIQNYFKNCVQDTDHGFSLIGTVAMGTTDSGLLLCKTDSSGNHLWDTTYGGSKFENGYKIVHTPSNGYLLGGQTLSFSNASPINAGDWYLVQTDTAGNQLWQNYYGHPAYDDMGVNGLIATKDSSFLVSGNFVRNNISTSYNNYNGHIIKFNKDMGIEWDRQYIISESVEFKTIIELEDGNIAVVFMQKDEFPEFPQEQYLSGLMKLDASGNELWRKIYYPDNFDTSKTNFGILETVKQTPDGGFIMCGYNNKFGQPQQMWVVKTDSLGCDGYPPNCDTTIDISEQLFQISDLNIFPNPAFDFVSISTSKNLQNAEIVISDLFGKTVHEETVERNTNHAKINVLHFPRGVYVVKINGANTSGMGKFVKF